MQNEMIVQLQNEMGEELATRHSLLWQMFMEAYKNRDIEKAYSLILLNPEIMANGLTVIYHSLPDEKKFSLPLECYTQHGDRMPVVRCYVRQARKFMPPEMRMPAEFLKKPCIEIYRAGEEPIELAQIEFLGQRIWMLPGGFMTGTSSSARSATCTKQK